jgi:cell division initiation protein
MDEDMITPQDIQEKGFTKAVFGGYDMTEVDNFLEELTNDYGSLYKENAILKGKMKVLVEKVEEYRSTEDAMRMALLTAQKMGDDMVAKAKSESEEMLSNTEKDAAAKREAADKQLADEAYRIQEAKKATEEYVAASRKLCQQHMDFLAKLSAVEAPEVEAPAVDPAEAREEKIMDAAKAINESVSKIVGDEPQPKAEEKAEEPAAEPAQNPDEDEPTKVFKSPGGVDWDDDDEPTSPRPKFNFENLQFGDNYDPKN